MGLNYKASGVDIQKASKFKKRLKNLAKSSLTPSVLGGIGGFGSFFSFPKNKYKDPVLVSSSDGVGTKLKIAFMANKHDTIGIDAVAMNVNDILCTGAKPLFFVDYIACGQLKSGILYEVVKGINAGCIQSGCSLVGGETAEMPGMYRRGEYDIAGFCVGVVEKGKIINGSRIKPGNIVIGLESSGIHSNGYSLVRRALSGKDQKKYCRELLKPTRIYVKPVLSILGPQIKGIAHITGGAFYDKIARILPDNVDVKIYRGSWRVPQIFGLIQEKGKISVKDMYHTFNMGVGMVLIVDPGAAGSMIKKLKRQGMNSCIIGHAVSGSGRVKIL